MLTESFGTNRLRKRRGQKNEAKRVTGYPLTYFEVIVGPLLQQALPPKV